MKIEPINYIQRTLEPLLRRTLIRGRSILLLGPRQTGKTTLLERISAAHRISLIQPPVRQRYERSPELLAQEVAALPLDSGKPPLVVVDEVQKAPELLDVVQDLIDRRKAQFILTGSSARKLRRAPANLLPGRTAAFRLGPLTYQEYPRPSLEDRLVYGSLPMVYQTADPEARDLDLDSYVTTYLEEEVRAEALVRRIGAFGRFLELAASESGMIVNFRKLSQRIGVAHTTLMDYYQILEDCLIVERVEPYTESKTRQRLTRSQKYLFFDLGVRRAAAKEGLKPPQSSLGALFEQWVGLELTRMLSLEHPKGSLHFWSDPAGPEVDWVVRRQSRLIPIEVKWTEDPVPQDFRHLKAFLREYPQAGRGYVIARSPRVRKVAENLLVLPWQELARTLEP